MVRRSPAQFDPFYRRLRGPFPMALNDIVALNAVIAALKVNGKKQAIQEIAARAAELTGLGVIPIRAADLMSVVDSIVQLSEEQAAARDTLVIA